MLIEIHMLQNHAPSNLNRDEAGSPKSAVFGGSTRARISSQCLKRSIRRSSFFAEAVKNGSAFRTRQLPELVRDALKREGFDDDKAEMGARLASGLGTKEGKEGEKDEDGKYATRQTMFISDADVAAATAWAKAQLSSSDAPPKGKKKAKSDNPEATAAFKAPRPIPAEIALFGRMITDEAFRDVDSALQVAHALSTHPVEQEYDYFTAVDDLQGKSGDDESGADMIGDTEFNSACYYKYFSIDVDALISNLESGKSESGTDAGKIAASREAAASIVGAFTRAAARVTPSGKQNTFAAHQLPALVFAEVRNTKAPVSYANAFAQSAGRAGGDIIGDSKRNLARHASAMTKSYNLESSSRLALEPEGDEFQFDEGTGWVGAKVGSLDELVEQIEGIIRAG